MSKKIIILIILLLFILGIIGWFIIGGKTGPQEGVKSNSPSFFTNLFPFGNNSDVNDGRDEQPISGDGQVDSNGQISKSGKSLQKLTNSSVVGYTSTSTENGINVRYMDRSTGNINDVDIEKLTNRRITNTTAPGMHEMIWHESAINYVLRYTNENNVLKTYVGKIKPTLNATSSDFHTISGNFMEDNTPFITTNAENTEILYLYGSKTGGSFGATSEFNTDAGDDSFIFKSPFYEWILEWPSNNLITATTKASGVANGFMYFVNPNNGNFSKVLGGFMGLTTNTNPEGLKVLYSISGENSLILNVYDTKEKITKNLPVTTLPEKCVWDNIDSSVVYCGVPNKIVPAIYPDGWYKGEVSFSDEIWKINTESLIIDKISTPTVVVGTQIDLIDPTITEDGQYLLFKNKKDSTLWSLRLEEKVVEEVEEDAS